MKLKIIIPISLFLSLFFVISYIYYNLFLWQSPGPEKVFKIKEGESFSSINYRLKKESLISDSRLFHKYAQYQQLLTKFRSGDYLIPAQSKMFDIFSILLKGKAIVVKVTIPEGKNIYEIADLLAKKEIVSKEDFLEVAKSSRFAKEQNISGSTVEGFLYPETYFFSKNTKAKSIIRKMIAQFKKEFSKLMTNSLPNSLSIFQIVTLASIVEKETGAAFERPIIAGVFHNRLKRGMRLQSDPTTIYGIYEKYKGNLTKKHLYEKTPYNTYAIPALPIGPISNPGKDALQATITPNQHRYLYFVSKNNGTHIFSKTYKEHQNAVRRWQKTRSNRSNRSWRDLNNRKTLQ